MPLVDQHLLRTSLQKTLRRLDVLQPVLARLLSQKGSSLDALRELHEDARRHALYEVDCLADSICAVIVLRAHGYEPELRLGVRSTSGSVEAHAWVEVGDTVFNDRADIAKSYELLQIDAWSAWLAEAG